MNRTAARSVTVIPPTINPLTHLSRVAVQTRRVAGYARVSTDSDEQFTSYEAQVDYYTQYIKRNPEWEFVKVYTDEGISATNTKHRIGFNEMIADAMSGKIDLIVTKSVSRFARNTVDSLVTIRKLKEKGVEVYFEKEKIYTFDGKGELRLTIMSSLAQEESRSLSENVTWGQRKRFADGKVNRPYKQFLSYRKGADGFPEVVPEEAIVRRRFPTGKGGGHAGFLAVVIKAESMTDTVNLFLCYRLDKHRALLLFIFLLFIPAVAVGAAGGERVLPHKVGHAARLAHGVVQTAQRGSEVI